MKILSFLEKNGINFKKTGRNYICRCPICKGDNQLNKCNAQINPNFNNIYCYSEGKVYFASDIRSAVRGKAL